MENRTEQKAKTKIAAAKEKWGERFCEFPSQEKIALDAKRLERIAFEVKDRMETVLFFLEQDNPSGLNHTSLDALSKDFSETCLRLKRNLADA